MRCYYTGHSSRSMVFGDPKDTTRLICLGCGAGGPSVVANSCGGQVCLVCGLEQEAVAAVAREHERTGRPSSSGVA